MAKPQVEAPPVAVRGVVLSGKESQAYLLRYYLGKRTEELRPEALPVRPVGYVPVSYKVTKRETDYYAL